MQIKEAPGGTEDKKNRPERRVHVRSLPASRKNEESRPARVKLKTDSH